MSERGHYDPVTGDPLTAGEWLSWVIQGVIRRWTFLGVVTLVTLLVWSTRNGTALLWWNLGASYLAIVIESIVGIAMMNQTKRDALVLREVRAMSQQMNAVLATVAQDVEHIEIEIDGDPRSGVAEGEERTEAGADARDEDAAAQRP